MSQKVVIEIRDGEPFVVECPNDVVVEIRVIEDSEPEETPARLTCHNPRCTRYGLTMAEMVQTAYQPDEFCWSEELDTWTCPDCGGTDVG